MRNRLHIQSTRYDATENKRSCYAAGSTQFLRAIASHAVGRTTERWLRSFRASVGGNALGDLGFLMTCDHLAETPPKPQQKRKTSGTHLRSYTDTQLPITQDIHTALPAFGMLKDAALYSLDGGIGPKSLLKFARGMDAARYTGSVEVAFEVWWTFAQHRMAGADECRSHFLILFRATVTRLKPLKVSALEGAIDYANTALWPPGLDGSLAKLANGCAYLQRLNGREPFFLSVRGAAKIMGMKNPFHASAYLLELERVKFIETVVKGAAEGRRATTYRFIK